MKFIDTHHDTWHAVVGEDGPQPHPVAAPNRLLTLEQWHAVREHWPADVPVALALPNDTDVEALEADLPRIAMIALPFPKWTDGRAYSLARLLRSRLGYTGEVRATGEVVVDMLPLLQRTGFDAVELRGDQRVETAKRQLTGFPGHYQGDVQQTQPLFGRQASSFARTL